MRANRLPHLIFSNKISYLNTKFYILFFLERERERMEEKRQRIEERKKLMASTTTATKSVEKPEDTKGSKITTKKKDSSDSPTTPNHVKGSSNKEELREPQLKIEVHATATHHEAEQQLEPKVAHSQSHEFSHDHAVSS